MAKTLSFTIMHFSVAFGVAWLLTGDVVTGGLVAVVEPLINSVAYYFHEQAWQKFRAGHAAPAVKHHLTL